MFDSVNITLMICRNPFHVGHRSITGIELVLMVSKAPHFTTAKKLLFNKILARTCVKYPLVKQIEDITLREMFSDLR